MKKYIETKYCVNCTHCRIGKFGTHYCMRPNGPVSLVTGKPPPLVDTDCEYERSTLGECGPSGNYFKLDPWEY